MGLMGIIVRNMSADVTIIASVRLSLGFVFLLGFLVVTNSCIQQYVVDLNDPLKYGFLVGS